MKSVKTLRAQVGQLVPLILALVTIAIVLGIGFLIMAEIQDATEAATGVNSTGQASDGNYSSAAWNATATTVDAMSDIPTWLPIIVITVIGALLLGLVAIFQGRRR